jgi:hypothetical protein
MFCCVQDISVIIRPSSGTFICATERQLPLVHQPTPNVSNSNKEQQQQKKPKDFDQQNKKNKHQ